MRDGAIEQVAPPLEVYHRSANTFVARFVGSPAMNVWTCASRRVEGRLRLVSPVLSIELEDTGAVVPDGIDVTVGVRPHDIDLVPDGEGDGTGRVEVVEPFGSATVVHLRVDGSPDELMRTIVPADTPIAPGQTAGFRLRRDRLHLFDARSGRRLADEPARDAGVRR
jgi:ABC-type sugar transport system ATPase subunit